MSTVLTIDGSQGEGGGQILRSSLALSLVTGRPVHLEKIRAGREKPGLMRQHLAAVRAAGQIGGAEIEGDEIGSQSIVFRPSALRPGTYSFSVGTAGSATLVLQTVLPALLVADKPSELVLEGERERSATDMHHGRYQGLVGIGVGIQALPAMLERRDLDVPPTERVG